MKSQIVSAIALAVSLLACAQETTPPSAAQGAVAFSSQAESARVIVQFKNPATIDAQAFVQRLQTLTASPAYYVAAISTDTHVYILKTPPGQGTTQLLEQLSALPEIARAEVDQKAKGR